MIYLYIVLGLIYGGACGYVGFQFGARIKQDAQNVSNVAKKL